MAANPQIRPIWILTTPRTGSTALARTLNSSGLLDPPLAEYFNSEAVDEPWAGLQLPRNCKVMPEQTDRWREINTHWPHAVLVHLVRNDLVAQIASTIIAIQTGVWIANQRTPYQVNEIAVRITDVQRIRSQIRIGNATLRAWLSTREHMVVTYESLSHRTARRILRLAGASKFPKLRNPVERITHPDRCRVEAEVRDCLEAISKCV